MSWLQRLHHETIRYTTHVHTLGVTLKKWVIAMQQQREELTPSIQWARFFKREKDHTANIASKSTFTSVLTDSFNCVKQLNITAIYYGLKQNLMLSETCGSTSNLRVPVIVHTRLAKQNLQNLLNRLYHSYHQVVHLMGPLTNIEEAVADAGGFIGFHGSPLLKCARPFLILSRLASDKIISK